MLAQERQNIILEMLRERKTIRVAELTGHFGASLATIRRDLEVLEASGHVRRVYGGAVLEPPPIGRTQQQFAIRKGANAAVKAEIGRAAAELIRDGETVVFDVGTTTFEVARHVNPAHKLTVLTNSLPILNQLAGGGQEVYSLGGRLRMDELCFSGEIAMGNLQAFYADKAFVGAGGVTLGEGVSDFNQEGAQLRRLIMERARETVLVTDSGKFGVNAFAIVCEVAKVGTVVTDGGIPAEYVKEFKNKGIRLIIADAAR